MMATYTLPDLPYDYAALEPAISGEILEQHHDKHHTAYVKGANGPLEQLAESRDTGQSGTLAGLEKTLAFNLSGHGLHSIFWQNLSGDAGDRPDGALDYEPLGRRLIVQQVYDHNGNIGQASIPLLVFDAWEHAYYLQYRNVRPATPANSGISSTGPMSSPATSRRGPARPDPAAGHDAA
jgi:Fe-Mn family superoxide dismutase